MITEANPDTERQMSHVLINLISLFLCGYIKLFVNMYI